MYDGSPEPWEQVLAGIDLLSWSRLCSWNDVTLTFAAIDESAYEAGHSGADSRTGRLLSWIAFGVGAEYLIKGVSMLRGIEVTTTRNVIQPPATNENLDTWAAAVKRPDRLEPATVTKTLAILADSQAFRRLVADDVSIAAIKLLASRFRNRDAHVYAKNVPAMHSYLVPSLFVPALNRFISLVDEPELRQRVGRGAASSR